MHSAQLVAPVLLVIYPAAQSEQEEAPAASPYLPASHALQVDAPDPLYVPTPQLEQLHAAVSLYLPLAHDEQLVYPTPL